MVAVSCGTTKIDRFAPVLLRFVNETPAEYEITFGQVKPLESGGTVEFEPIYMTSNDRKENFDDLLIDFVSSLSITVLCNGTEIATDDFRRIGNYAVVKGPIPEAEAKGYILTYTFKH